LQDDIVPDSVVLILERIWIYKNVGIYELL